MKLTIMKKQKDPLAMRISIGGNLSEAYCVYRGDLKQIQMLLKAVEEEMEKLKEEPPTSDDMGKKYA
jgi:hypothetical protein